MSRLTNNDHRFGAITYAKTDWNPLRIVLSSGGGDDDDDDDTPRNTLTAYAFGWVARINLPRLIAPFRVKHIASTWDAATVERMGRNWYFKTFPREYGFSLHNGFLQLFLGAQTHDSETTQDWATHLPWTQWRHVRFSLYGASGAHFWTQLEVDRKKGGSLFQDQLDAEKSCPKAAFIFDDYDGKRISATTHIEEREWRFGEGWFKWLSLFRRPKVRRSLDIRFSEEVGPEKGSWKGGMMGHGIEMLPGELHEAAFRRYCEQEHRSKHQRFKIKFIGAEGQQ